MRKKRYECGDCKTTWEISLIRSGNITFKGKKFKTGLDDFEVTSCEFCGSWQVYEIEKFK